MNFVQLIKFIGEKARNEVTLNEGDLVNFLSTALTDSMWFGIDNSSPEFDDEKYESDCFEGRLAKILLDGKPLKFYDLEGTEEDDDWTLTLEKLDKGADKFFEDYDYLVRRIIKEGGMDLETADALLQCCVLGDIIFG